MIQYEMCCVQALYYYIYTLITDFCALSGSCVVVRYKMSLNICYFYLLYLLFE